MVKALLMVRFGEIALKGKNRGFFENTLTGNIRKAVRDLADCRVYQTRDRNYVEVRSGDVSAVITGLQKVFGIVSLSPVAVAGLDIEDIKKTALAEFAKTAYRGKSFKVETRRGNKSFPLTSPEVSREIGAFILKHLPELAVDVHTPQIILDVEIREKETYICTEKIAGPGGLPVGTAGKGLLLLSGGIDSPVAGWMAMKRGVSLEALHFHSFPFTSERSKEKVTDLCRLLAGYTDKIPLHMVHFTDIQKELRLKCPEKMIVTLMRRMMFRIAGRLAVQRRALALFTGESLGQVASQTMESLSVIEGVVDLPVLRPLIGLDKTEITALSRRIDAYSISIRPYEDCCTIFLPKYPETRPRLPEVEEAEKDLEIEAMVENSLAKTEVLEISRSYSPR